MTRVDIIRDAAIAADIPMDLADIIADYGIFEIGDLADLLADEKYGGRLQFSTDKYRLNLYINRERAYIHVLLPKNQFNWGLNLFELEENLRNSTTRQLVYPVSGRSKNMGVWKRLTRELQSFWNGL